MVLGDAALTADRGGHGRVEQLSERAELRLRAGDHRTAAADEERTFGGQDRFCRILDRRRVRRHPPGGIAAQGGVGVHGRLVDRVPLHVERQAQMSGARPAAGHLPERGAHRARDLVGAIDHPIPLREWAEQGLLVELGQDVASARADRDIGGHGEYRNRRFVRFDDARQDVGRATAGWPLAHPDAAGDPGMGVGHVRGGALVAGQHVGDAVVEAVQRVVQRQAGVAAQAEDVAHAVQLQHARERLRPRQSVHRVLIAVSPKSSGDPGRPSNLCSPVKNRARLFGVWSKRAR
jgi:hypothetical protein